MESSAHNEIRVAERRDARRAVHREVRIATTAETPMPMASMIDASDTGVLIATDEAFGVAPDHRLCVSIALDDGPLHLIGRVVRVARGTDFRTYIGLQLDLPYELGSLRAKDSDRWRRWVRATAHAQPSDGARAAS
ncbi:MAG: PilZ domain-containing protein [Acidimicrobiia bacterium]